MRAHITLSKLSSKRGLVWDTELTGFGAYVAANGRITWLVQCRRGKATRLTFGKYPALSLTEARARAKTLIGEFADGADIGRQRKETIDTQRQALSCPTLDDAFADYMTEHADGSLYWVKVQGLFDRFIPSNQRINLITKHDIKLWLKPLKPGAKRWIFTFLRPFFKWAVREELITSNPMIDLLPPPPANERDRILNTGEIRSLWAVCTDLGYVFGDITKLLLLTGQRLSEVAGMQWSEIDLVKQQWIIPASRAKTDTAHIVHLSEPAREILASVSRTSGHDYVFSSRAKVSPSGFSNIKREIDRRLPSIPHWTFHDLRRTAASHMCAIGVAPHVIDKILNHAIPSKVRRIYQRYEYLKERQDALDLWGNYLGEICLRSTGQSPITQTGQTRHTDHWQPSDAQPELPLGC